MIEKKEETTQQVLVSVGLPLHVVLKVDEIRGDIPRSTYLRKKIIAAVEEDLTQITKAV